MLKTQIAANSNQVAPQSESGTSQTSEKLELIRARAYEIYEARGKQDGYAEEDWMQAECDILSSMRSSQAAA